MENRRQHFRYSFTPKAYWKATFCTFDGSKSFSGEIVNLSIGGMNVKLEPGHTAKGDRWIVTLVLSTQDGPLHIPVQRVHPNNDEPGFWGFRFVSKNNLTEQQERERLIWRFILEEQRRDRREAALRTWWSA